MNLKTAASFASKDMADALVRFQHKGISMWVFVMSLIFHMARR